MEDRLSKANRSRLSWWFPRIPSDIPTPHTHTIYYPGDSVLINVLDGKIPSEFGVLCNQIINAGNLMAANDRGWPIFLRTDYLSGKHNWEDTCFIQKPGDVPNHVVKLVEISFLVDLWGFPVDRWIVREMIPTTPAFVAFHGDMPIVKERRYFVRDDQVVCHHPYWPPEAFVDQPVSVDDWVDRLREMNREDDDEVYLLSDLSSRVGAAIGGEWSIDWLWSEEKGKWFLTDMADASVSYHWPGCEKQYEFSGNKSRT